MNNASKTTMIVWNGCDGYIELDAASARGLNIEGNTLYTTREAFEAFPVLALVTSDLPKDKDGDVLDSAYDFLTENGIFYKNVPGASGGSFADLGANKMEPLNLNPRVKAFNYAEIFLNTGGKRGERELRQYIADGGDINEVDADGMSAMAIALDTKNQSKKMRDIAPTLVAIVSSLGG